MAIETTRGLPSFSEMYQAYKNRGNIGQALEAGVTGYLEGKSSTASTKHKVAEANKYNAEAESLRNKITNPTQGMFDIRPLEADLGPKLFSQLVGTATKGNDGGLYIPNTEAIQYIKMAQDEAQRQQQTTEHGKSLAQGAAGQELSAAQSGATATRVTKPPSMLEEGLHDLGTAVERSSTTMPGANLPYVGRPIQALTSFTGKVMQSEVVPKYRQNKKFVQKLEERGGVSTPVKGDAAANKAAIKKQVKAGILPSQPNAVDKATRAPTIPAVSRVPLNQGETLFIDPKTKKEYIVTADSISDALSKGLQQAR